MPSPERTALLIGNFLSRHGYSRSVGEELSMRLAKRAWDIQTASSARSSPARLVDMIASCIRYSRSVDAVLIEVYSGRAFLWAEVCARIVRGLGRPYVAALHGGALPEFRQRHLKRVASLLGNACAVTAPSRYLFEAFQDLRPDIHIVPNALDLRLYPNRERRIFEPHLMWLRAFHHIYNPNLAVRVLSLLRKQYPAARLTMIGGDKHDGSLGEARRLAVTLGLHDAVRFRGPVPKHLVGRALAQGDIFLNTSRIDNTPVSVIEAMACGLCVISTDVGGIRHLIRDGHNGVLTPSDDAEAIHQALLSMLSQPERSFAMTQKAISSVQDLDWANVLEKWEAILNICADSWRRRVAAVTV